MSSQEYAIKGSLKQYKEYLEHFPAVDRKCCDWTKEKLPALLMPPDLFIWKETLVYYAFFAILTCREKKHEPLYFLNVSAYDEELRRTDPEIARLAQDGWVIPFAYKGEDRKRELYSHLGFGEGWADSFDVFTVIIPYQCEKWIKDIFRTRTLCLFEHGRDTGSMIVDVERTIVSRFNGFFKKGQ
ncbi:MAG: hypothetical protein JW827_03645 [Spirochaetes bacterium]|nr:hypothetical protein [Spirochaetota bacterium]